MIMLVFVSFRGSDETCGTEVEEEEGWSCYGAKKGGELHLDGCCSRRPARSRSTLLEHLNDAIRSHQSVDTQYRGAVHVDQNLIIFKVFL